MAASGLSCGMRDLLLQHVGSLLRCASFSLVVARGLSSCGAWAPEGTDSVVAALSLSRCGVAGSALVAHRLNCPAACGILVPRPGIELVSPVLQDRSSTTGPPRKSLLGTSKFPFPFKTRALFSLCTASATFMLKRCAHDFLTGYWPLRQLWYIHQHFFICGHFMLLF